jgi:hypothetical protein
MGAALSIPDAVAAMIPRQQRINPPFYLII